MTQERPQQTETQGVCRSRYCTMHGEHTCVLMAGHKSLCTDNDVQWERKAAPPAPDDVGALVRELELAVVEAEQPLGPRAGVLSGMKRLKDARAALLAAFARLKAKYEAVCGEHSESVDREGALLARIAALEREKRDWLDNDLTGRTMLAQEQRIMDLERENAEMAKAGWRACLDHIVRPDSPCPVCRVEALERENERLQKLYAGCR